MTQPRRQMSIGMNILGLGGHGAAWRVGEVPSNSYIIEYTGTTLRDHLGLSLPKNRFEAARTG